MIVDTKANGNNNQFALLNLSIYLELFKKRLTPVANAAA